MTEPTAVKTTKPYPPGIIDLITDPSNDLFVLIRAFATRPPVIILGLEQPHDESGLVSALSGQVPSFL